MASTLGKMQRLLAVLLLSVIGFLPVSSTFTTASAAQNLPACCRLLGKHHCSAAHSGGKPGVRSKADQCPFAPSVSSAVVSVLAFPSPAFVLSQTTLDHWVASAQAQTLLHFAFDRNGQKRGPPAFLA
jgi:hypothetical protein